MMVRTSQSDSTAARPRGQPDVADPSWLAHRYDESKDEFLFRKIDRQARRGIAFLTDEYLGADAPVMVLSASAAAQSTGAPAPTHYIFHSAFCGSTLACKTFDCPGRSSSFSEPVLLNDFVGWRRRHAPGGKWRERLSLGLKLLARPYVGQEACVIKPSNIVNIIAPELLRDHPGSRAIALHAPLSFFLASILGKGLEGRLWVRRFMSGFLLDGGDTLGFKAQALFEQTDLQIAALGWAAQYKLFSQLAATWPSRVMVLDSRSILERPRESLERIAVHYGLDDPDGIIKNADDSGMFSRNSKTRQSFDAQDQVERYARLSKDHHEELEKVFAWTEKVAQANGLSIPVD